MDNAVNSFVKTSRRLISHAFRWRHGQQDSGYYKMMLIEMPWPLAFDGYLLHYPVGTKIPPHCDPVKKRRHYRLNIVLRASKSGGEFICAEPIFETRRIKLFRPDICEHSVTRVKSNSRYVLSIGWLWGKQ